MKYDAEKIQEIIDENDDHNEDIGSDRRPRDRAKRDAELIYQIREGLLSVETLCMMLTDYEFHSRTHNRPRK